MTLCRGQMKMFETIAVLIVFFFLLAIISVFYLSAQRSSITDESTRLGEGLALQTVFKALYLPELDCSFLLSQKDNCMDVLKLKSFEARLQDESVSAGYFEEFKDARIAVSEIFPRKQSWLLYKHEPSVRASEQVTQSPVLLYDGRTDSYAFGVIEVRTY